MLRTSAYTLFVVTTNIISCILLLVAFVVFEKVLSPFNRGFFCDDESIQKPYTEKQTVPTYLLVVLAVLMILSVIITCDVFNYLQIQSKNTEAECDAVHIRVCSVFNVKKWLYRIAARIVLAFFGFAMCMVLTGIGKRMVGRLRPHFLAVCKPDYAKFNCSDGYITFDVCTGTNEKRLKEARLSFPSGHSSSAAFASSFFALYIQYVVQPRQFVLLKPLIQFCGVCLGVACALTRISDYFHHWSDVLVGYMIGILFGVYTIYILLKLPEEEMEVIGERALTLQRVSDEDVENQSTAFVTKGSGRTYDGINRDQKNS